MVDNLIVSPNVSYTVITDLGLELRLGAVELVQYIIHLSTQQNVYCTCSVIDDCNFIFRVSFTSV